MELKDFTEQEQEQIKQGLSTAEISDKEAGKKLLALPEKEGEELRKIMTAIFEEKMNKHKIK